MSNESMISKTPENTSILQSTKFTFLIPELPFARYFCQTVSLPGVSTTEVAVSSPFSNTYRHGDKLNYDVFSINAIVDEDLRVWEETYKWLVALTKPTKFSEYARTSFGDGRLYFDGVLTINTNANNPNLRIKFKNCHPTSLGAINFNTAENAETIPTADINFRYDQFEIVRL
jgi:hypothetical protein